MNSEYKYEVLLWRKYRNKLNTKTEPYHCSHLIFLNGELVLFVSPTTSLTLLLILSLGLGLYLEEEAKEESDPEFEIVDEELVEG